MSRIPLGILASSLPSGGNALTLISTQLITGTPSTVTFSSIPGTYNHLQLRMTMKNSNGGSTMDTGYFTLNGDTTTTNYSLHYLSGNGSGVNTSYSNSYVGNLRGVATSLFTSSAYSGHIMDILDYANTSKNKTVRVLGGAVNSTYSAYEVALTSAMRMNTSAITSITIGALSGQTFVSGCRFSLYGVS